MVLDEKIKKVIKILANVLNKNNINWMLIGSCNLTLQGMDLNPRDIDICVNLRDFDKLKKLFFYYNGLEFGQFPSKFGGTAFRLSFFIEGIEIEFVGEGTQSIYSEVLANEDFNKLEIFGAKIYVNKLENGYLAYHKIGRTEKAAKIKEYLDSLISA